MKLRTKFLLFVIILHLTALVLSFFIFKDDKLIFIISEIFILLSAYLSWQLYDELIQPLKMLMQGTEAIRDRDFNIKFVETGKYEMDQLIRVYNQMIDQLRTERTKQEEQHFFLEKLIYTSPTGIMILDYEDKVQQINPMALQLLNMQEKEVIGRSISTMAHPVLQQVAQLQSGKSVTVTFDAVTTYKLQKAHFIDRGFPRHFITIEELTAEILAAEKKAYGKVIRMMAHEVNNTIGPVNSILQTALQSHAVWKENDTDDLRNALQVAVDRNNNLNIFMRNFADVVRLPQPHMKRIDLAKVIYSVTQLMKMKAGEKAIDFIFAIPSEPFFIDADEQQLEQVLINVVKNAIEAIAEKGTISFSLHRSTKQLVIADTGIGIPDNAAGNLFSPFFSTKKDGQGIGLTLVREILINHGFSFSLKTTQPGHTEFVIQFVKE